MIFDLIASQYGYTYDQFRQMTVREIHIAVTRILKRRNEEMKFQARCLGVEIKDDEVVKTEITEDQRSMFEAKARETLAKRLSKNV